MRKLLYFIVVVIAALLQQSCAAQKGTDGNVSYPVKLTDYADSQVVPYRVARNWVENSGRWHDDDRYFRVHLNWQEYKKHPLTKAELKEKYDSAQSVRKFLHSSNQQFGKNHKKVSKRLRSGSKSFDANDSVKVDVFRYANLNNDEEVQITYSSSCWNGTNATSWTATPWKRPRWSIGLTTQRNTTSNWNCTTRRSMSMTT